MSNIEYRLLHVPSLFRALFSQWHYRCIIAFDNENNSDINIFCGKKDYKNKKAVRRR